MSAWTESEKANIRAYLGFPALFHQLEPRLENAINAVQSADDGGALESSATQDRMRTVLTQLAAIDTKLTDLHCSLQVVEAGTDRVRLDVPRAIFMLRSEGRRLINQLAIPLGTRPVRDYYTGSELGSYNTDPSNPFLQDL